MFHAAFVLKPTVVLQQVSWLCLDLPAIAPFVLCVSRWAEGSWQLKRGANHPPRKANPEWPASLSLQSWTSRPCWGSTPTPTLATGRGWGQVMRVGAARVAAAPLLSCWGTKALQLGSSQLITFLTVYSSGNQIMNCLNHSLSDLKFFSPWLHDL